jgi:hypothetical protein
LNLLSRGSSPTPVPGVSSFAKFNQKQKRKRKRKKRCSISFKGRKTIKFCQAERGNNREACFNGNLLMRGSSPKSALELSPSPSPIKVKIP